MKWTTRVSGELILLLGVVGIIVCLVGIAATWKVRNRLDRTVVTTFSRIDNALTGLEDRAQRTNECIEGVQESLHGLNDRVQQRVAELRDESKDEAADIDGLERQLYARVQQVAAWIEFMQSTVDFVEQLLEMAESTSAFLQDDSRTMQDLVSSLRAGREEVNQTSRLVDEVKAGLIEIRAHRNVEKNAKQIKTLSSRINASLAKIQGYGQEFEAGIAETRTSINNLSERILRRLTVIAIICVLALLWMTAGQLSLAFQGRTILR